MPAWIGCLALGGGEAEGSVLVGLRTGAYRFGLADGALSLVAPAPYDPRRFFLNDGKCDRQGRFWVGPMRHALLPLVGEPGAMEGPLWRLEGDRLVAKGKQAALSNGLAWSPDGRTMYHSHTMVAFGGPELRTIFVTSGRWAIADKDAADHPFDGGIFALEAPVPGLPTSRWLG
jgi:sugar lactone lactonase YvrE